MAHPNEEIARNATQALSRGDMEGFLSHHADDVVVHFPGRGPMAGDHRGKAGVAQMFQRQMQILDAPRRSRRTTSWQAMTTWSS